MLREGNLELVEAAWVDCLNKKQSDAFLKLHSESVTMYDPTFPEPLLGRAALGAWFEGLFKMFPDYLVEKERSFGQEDWVCLEAVESGTMKGPIQGPSGQAVPATNKSFKIRSANLCKVKGGEISEIRLYYDVLGLMAQLGLGP